METAVTQQDQLFEGIKAIYSDAIPKKINTDSFLDVKIPSVIIKKSAHLYLNTTKDKIRVGVYNIDINLTEALLAKYDSIEKYSNGVRPTGNPSFLNVKDAIDAAKSLLDCISNISNQEENNTTKQNQKINDPIKTIEKPSVKKIDYSGYYFDFLIGIFEIKCQGNDIIGKGPKVTFTTTLISQEENLFEGWYSLYTREKEKISMKYEIDENRFESKIYVYAGDDRERLVLETDFERIDDIERIIAFPDGSIYYGDILVGDPIGFGKMFYANGDEYEGEFLISKRNGYGEMRFRNGNNYKGNWFVDFMDGVGTIKYSNDEVYEGEWSLNKRNGKGKLTFQNGEVQEGEFKDDKFVENKIKVINYEGGDKYEGEMKDGKKHGKGKYIWSSGNIYIGEWLNGEKTGKGKYIFSNGGVYEGDFLKGDYNGKGKYIWADGRVYDGEWKNDKQSGNGKMTYTDGDVYDGKWDDGKRIGKTKFEIQKENALAEEKRTAEANRGKVTFKVINYEGGDKYEGEMKDGKKHGKGKYTWADGRVYVGNWKDGAQNGNGKITFSDGDVYDGKWVDGERIGKTNFEIQEEIQKKNKAEELKHKKHSYKIEYRIKLKEEQGIFFKDKKGSYLKKSMAIEFAGDLPESKIKQYVMTNDKDILKGKAGSSTLIIDNIRKLS